MDSYSDIVSASSQALMSSLMWGASYFIVALAPLYIYIKKMTGKEERQNPTPFFEVVGSALIVQIGALLLFTILGTFVQTINIGNNDLKPEKGFQIFFGSGNELIDDRWGGYLTSFSTDSKALTSFGNEAKGVGFLANKYVGIVYRFFILLMFFIMCFFIIVDYMRKFKDGEQRVDVFSKMYSTAATTIVFVLVLNIHSIVAAAYPSFFGINEDAVAINFVAYFQKIIADIFYT